MIFILKSMKFYIHLVHARQKAFAWKVVVNIDRNAECFGID